MPDEAIGCGFHEAVRGVLSHHMVIRDGKIANYHPYPPTPWNASPRDIYGTPGPYEDAVQNTPIFEENGPDNFKGIDIMRAVRSFDPCLPCGVHMYLGGGRELERIHSPMFGVRGLTSMSRDAGATRDRIGTLVAAIDAVDDPLARDTARELLGCVLEMHGAGLARLVELVDGAGAAAGVLAERFAADDAVSAMLLLHGLHPHPLEQRVRRAVDRLHDSLAAQSVAVELVSAGEDRVLLRARITAGSGIGLVAADVEREIESAVLAAAPDVAAVEVDGLPRGEVKAIRFMPRVPVPARNAAEPADATLPGTAR